MNIIKPALLIAIIVAVGFLLTRTPASQPTPPVTPAPTNQSISSNCVPTFQDGGGPYYQSNSPFRSNIAPEDHTGEELTVTGKILQSDCVTPLANITLDIWQANESGNYEDGWYRGQVSTNDEGVYSFTTVVPKGYGEGTGYRPPHIHFKVWQGDQLLITSQMFLPISREQGIEDAYIIRLESTPTNGTTTHQGYHDIILP